MLFVGINPGIRSAETGHHFAGFSNRFWKLLFDARLVPEPVTYLDDDRLPLWGYGITNIVARATPGVQDLRPSELAAGRASLVRKIARWKPRIVAVAGVMIYRALFPDSAGPLRPGLARDRLAGVPVFILPNPSGRNAHYSYGEMLAAFVGLRRLVERTTPLTAAAARRRARRSDPDSV